MSLAKRHLATLAATAGALAAAVTQAAAGATAAASAATAAGAAAMGSRAASGSSPLAATAAGGGPASWWQVIGGSLAVFALLVLFLRLLARWQSGPRARQASLLAVVPLGPRREIQVVRLRDQVHYIYRHEGALLALDRQPYGDYAAAPVAPEWGGQRWPALLRGLVRRDAGPGAGADRERGNRADRVDHTDRADRDQTGPGR